MSLDITGKTAALAYPAYIHPGNTIENLNANNVAGIDFRGGFGLFPGLFPVSCRSRDR